ncbi:MAG TPA: AI-2E family transporter [Thermoanaerobaculia bacterium]|nr:AI-2E family transporter [Thermoanaerobaculia bacterium]
MKREGADRIEVVIPVTTILKLLLAALLVFLAIRLWTPFLMVFLAVLLAVTMEPFVAWMSRHRVRRGIGVLVVSVLLVLFLLLLFAIIIPEMAVQMGQVATSLPAVKQRLGSALPAKSPLLRNLLDQLFNMPGKTLDEKTLLSHSVKAGKLAMTAVTAFIFVIVLTIYFLLEGKQFYAWLVSYIPRDRRGRMRQTANEVSVVVMSYMRGQLITSALCGGFVFLVLMALQVPAPMPLAFFAAVCDIIPVVGTILMTVPAVLVALTISPGCAGAVLLAYLFYHLVENYLIAPRVYGKQMRLSTLAVLLALGVGGTLEGVLGAILALPIAAAYPIIERTWLREYLSDEVLEDHEALDQEEPQRVAEAAEDVLRGKPPA